MPASRLVTGTHTFTFPYRIDGGWATEFDCRCSYEIYRGRPAVLEPHPGEPGEPDEIREISDIEVEVFDEVPREEVAKGAPRYRGRWVPAGDLEGTIRRYLSTEGARDLIYEAATGGEPA